jgi:hypothetical protein
MVGVILPVVIQGILPDAQHILWNTESGKILINLIPLLAMGFAGLSVVGILATVLTIDESYLASKPIEKKSITGVFKQTFLPLKHHNAVLFYENTFTMNVGLWILTTVLLPILTFVVNLEGIWFSVFIAILVPIAFLAMPFWGKMMNKLHIKRSYEKSYIFLIPPMILVPIILLSMGFELRFAITLILFSFGIFGFCAFFLIPTPLISAVIDEGVNIFKDQTLNRSQLAGTYFGLNSFTTGIATAAATLILGLIYTGGRANDPLYLVLALPISAIIFGLAYFSIKLMKIDPQST